VGHLGSGSNTGALTNKRFDADLGASSGKFFEPVKNTEGTKFTSLSFLNGLRVSPLSLRVAKKMLLLTCPMAQKDHQPSIIHINAAKRQSDEIAFLLTSTC